MISRVVTFLGAMLLGIVCSAQSKLLKEADALFYTKKYREAYSAYEKIYDKKPDKALLVKMADCNYYIENYPLAQKYYSMYFTDTLYHATPDYMNYANASRLSGKIREAMRLYGKINEYGGDANTRQYIETYKAYFDTSVKIRVYNLDSVYTCVDLDATESVDAEAAPMIYLWDFKDGAKAEGSKITHCFKSAGIYTISLSIKDKATGYMRVNDTTVTVIIDEPTVKFKSPKKARQFFYTTFEAEVPFIYNHEVQEYIWDFGNGEYAMGKKVQMQFNKLEFLNVKLTVMAKNKEDAKLARFASCRAMEVVDNYSDHSQTFKDNLNGEKK